MVERTHRVEHAQPIPSFEPIKEGETTHFPIYDTLEPSQNLAAYIPSKPVLTPPSCNLIKQIERLEVFSCDVNAYNRAQLDRYFQKLEELDRLEAQKMKEELDRADSANFWSFLQDMAALINTAFSAVFGISLLATGASPILGGILITAGVLSMVNYAFQHLEVWDWVAHQLAAENEEQYQQLKTVIPAAVGVTAAVVGIAGSAGAAWFTELNFLQEVMIVGERLSGFATGGTFFAKSVAEGRLKLTRGELITLKKESRLTHKDLSYAMSELIEFFDEQGRMHEKAARLLAAGREALQITQQVI